MPDKKTSLSPLETDVIQVIWDRGSATAAEVRRALEPSRPLKESTVRTLLRRIETKGFLEHRVDGRTYVYRPVVPRHQAAARAVRQIIDRFCGGSVEALLVGMVNDDILDENEIEKLADRLRREAGEKQEETDED